MCSALSFQYPKIPIARINPSQLRPSFELGKKSFSLSGRPTVAHCAGKQHWMKRYRARRIAAQYVG